MCTRNITNFMVHNAKKIYDFMQLSCTLCTKLLLDFRQDYR